jgi:predicted O-linked N-acetylglucosamine transferase (SPINDLY family)
MSFKKLALVTAMFAATSGAYAMEAMDDESMAAATGQDGITIGITTNALTLDQRIHDRDGYFGSRGC